MIKIFVLLYSLHCILSVHAKKFQFKMMVDEGCSDYQIDGSEINDFTTIENYRGQYLRRRWDLKSGPITLAQDTNNAVALSWTKYNMMVTLQLYSNKAVDQKWQFRGATITIKIGSNRSIYQMWNLGQKWFHYEKSSNGAVKAEGNANARDLDEYKRAIDCWCQENDRFFPLEYCIVYDNYEVE